MATVDELRQWCETARKLLKTSGRLKVTDSDATIGLRKELDSLAKLLKQIEGDRRMIPVYKECMAGFERLQRRLDMVARSKQNASDKEKNELQVTFTHEFEALEEKVREAVEKANEERQAIEALSLARGEYMKAYMLAVQAIELLKVIPKSNPVMVEGKLTTIHEQSKQDTVEAYGIQCEALKKLMGEIKEQTKAAENMRQLELKQFEKRPEAQKKLDEAQRLLAELEGLVGIEAELVKYRSVIGAAVKAAEADNWSGVLAKLEELKGLPNAKKCAELSEAKGVQLAKEPAYVEGMAALKKLDQLLAAEAVGPLRQGLLAKANALYPPSGVSDPQALPELRREAQALQTAVQDATRQTSELSTLSEKIINLRSEMKGLVPELEMLGVEVQFDTFTSLCQGKLLAQAQQLGETLKAALEKDLPAKRADKQSWEKDKGKAAQIAQQLEGLRKSPCATVVGRVAPVMQYVAPAFVQIKEKDHAWTQLLADLARARQLTDELLKMDGDHVALKDQRDDWQRELTKTENELKQLIDKLGVASAKAQRESGGEPFDASVRFQADINEAKAAWLAATKNLADKDALEAVFESTGRSYEVVREDLVAAAQPQGLERLALLDKQAKFQPEFDRLYQSFRTEVEKVRALYTNIADALDTMGKQVSARAAANYQQGASDIQELLLRAKTEVSRATRMRNEERSKVTQLAQEALDEINRVKKESKNAKAFAEAFAALATEHAELVQLATSNNLEAVEEATRGLIALKERASKFAPENNKGDGVSLDKTMLLLLAAEKQLADLKDTLKENDPKALVRLTGRLVELKKEVTACDPADGIIKVAEFTKSVTEAETGAKVVVETRTKFERLEPLTLAAFKTFDERKVAPEYAKVLKSKLGEVHTLAENPAKLFEALTKLETLDREIGAASRDLQVAMKQEGQVRADAHKAEATKLEYERSVKVFESRYLNEAKAAVKSKKGDEALIKELERMVGLARQSHKDGDNAKALQQIQLTMERAQQIAADPYGPAIGSRNNLPKDQQVWREALTAFNQTLDTVRDTTLKAVPAIHADAEAKLRTMIEALKTKLDPNTFEGPLRQLTQDGIPDTERRTHRETALARVRAARATLEGNPQIQLLLQNPAAKSAFSLGYRRVQSALLRLDANIQRSVH